MILCETHRSDFFVRVASVHEVFEDFSHLVYNSAHSSLPGFTYLAIEQSGAGH